MGSLVQRYYQAPEPLRIWRAIICLDAQPGTLIVTPIVTLRRVRTRSIR
jgi:hypothetical protein